MELKSLALRTDLILDHFFASVVEKEDYIVVRTEERATYFWGNYIIMRDAPKEGDYKKWVSIFEDEIGRRDERGFVAITFDTDDGSDSFLDEFKAEGFAVRVSKVLVTDEVQPPPRANSRFEIRPFSRESDWERFVEIHFTPNWGYGSDEGQREFLADEMMSFKRLVSHGNAQRFGAYLDGEMVADLGVYWRAGVARFNNVATHSDFRRRGACSTLVYEVSRDLLSRSDIDTLVMEADEEYHAAKIYESVGFRPSQRSISLEWKDPERYPEDR